MVIVVIGVNNQYYVPESNNDRTLGINSILPVNLYTDNLEDLSLNKLESTEEFSFATKSDNSVISIEVNEENDTLEEISNNYSISEKVIKEVNNITEDSDITKLTNIIVPPVEGAVIEVNDEDNIIDFANQHNISLNDVIKRNDIPLEGTVVQGSHLIVLPGISQKKANENIIGDVAINISTDIPTPTVSPVSTNTYVAPANDTAINYTQTIPNVTSYYNTYAWGHCTYYVASQRPIPSYWGNANTWYYNAQVNGWATGAIPQVGAVAWTSAGPWGHVALVEAVDGNQVLVSEMNYAGNWNIRTSRWAPASSFLYIY